MTTVPFEEHFHWGGAILTPTLRIQPSSRNPLIPHQVRVNCGEVYEKGSARCRFIGISSAYQLLRTCDQRCEVWLTAGDPCGFGLWRFVMTVSQLSHRNPSSARPADNGLVRRSYNIAGGSKTGKLSMRRKASFKRESDARFCVESTANTRLQLSPACAMRNSTDSTPGTMEICLASRRDWASSRLPVRVTMPFSTSTSTAESWAGPRTSLLIF